MNVTGVPPDAGVNCKVWPPLLLAVTVIVPPFCEVYVDPFCKTVAEPLKWL